MQKIDDILRIASPGEFDRAAMELFRWQADRCPPYREYLSAIGVEPREVAGVDQIPYLPIEIFKTHRVYCGGSGLRGGSGIGDAGVITEGRGEKLLGEPEAVFTSSGASASRHYVARLADYEAVFTRAFELFYGPAAGWNIRALLPSYVERGGSSLVYMVEGLQRLGASGRIVGDQCGKISSPDQPRKDLLIGVSYALLDLAEEMTARGEKLPAGTVVMETGGMKGRREEMPKWQLHKTLQEAFGVAEIHSEYGMCELTSQAYSAGGGVFRTPPWMRVSVRDLVDPFDVRRPAVDKGVFCGDDMALTDGVRSSVLRGGINIIDLGNLHSCAFIQTGDVGTVAADGSFTIDGRIAGSDIRGCNLLVRD